MEAHSVNVFRPFKYMGGHGWDMIGPRHFKCKCNAILYWRDDGLYEIIDGPVICPFCKPIEAMKDRILHYVHEFWRQR